MKNELEKEGVTKGLIPFVECLVPGGHWADLGALVHATSFMSGQKLFYTTKSSENVNRFNRS
jgi:hypothetical protein